MLVSARIVEDMVGQRAPLILLTIEDVTENKRMVDTLRASEERFRTLFNLGPVAVYYCDVSGTIQNFNRRAVELWGRTPAAGDTDEQFRRSYKLSRPDGSSMPYEQCPMAQVLSGRMQEARDQEVLIERPDGTRIVVVNIRPLKKGNGQITGAISCFYDISDRKLSEAALIKSEKLAAAGRLAATLAHEINNPLQAVANLVTIWAQSPGLDAQGQAFAARADNELRRVSHLTQQALSFYRDSNVPTPVNVEETIDGVLSIYEKRLEAKEINVARRYQSGGATIKTYPGELRQVLSTMLLNAVEAVGTGGTIAVRARKASYWQNGSAQGIRVTFSDNGVGIPASNMSRIFETIFYDQRREWDRAGSLGGERYCGPFGWLDSDTKQRASRQTRDLLFGLSAHPILNATGRLLRALTNRSRLRPVPLDASPEKIPKLIGRLFPSTPAI